MIRDPHFRPLMQIFLVLMMILSVAVAQARAADRDRLEAFLEVTGFGVALDSIALAATDAPEMLGLSASDFGNEWSQVAQEVFAPEKMRMMGLNILEQALSDDLLSHAAGFYASDLGQRLVAVENASHMVEDDAAKQKEGEAMVAALVAEGSDRLAVLRDMNKAIDASGHSVRAVQEIQVRFLMAASHAGVLEQPLDEGMLRALMKETEGELRLSLQKSGLAAAAYTYQDISTEDLRSYQTALENPNMQKVYELMNAVQYEIMANRFEALAAEMAGLERGQEL